MMKAKFIGLLSAFMVMAQGVAAHDFFVNLTHALTARPSSAIAQVSWGHTLPLDDFFPAPRLEGYHFYDPELNAMNLPFDERANEEDSQGEAVAGIRASRGDSLAVKLHFDEKARGVYQVAAVTKRMQFSWWRDEKNRSKWGMHGLDEIKNPKEILLSWDFQSFAKAYVSVGEWQNPKPIGHELELIALSDLSKVKVGDEVEFEVLFLGKPLHEITDGMPPAIRAYGEQGGAGYVGAFVKAGKVKFRVHSSGRWVATLSLKKKVSEESAPELVGKALHKGYNASVTFFVRER